MIVYAAILVLLWLAVWALHAVWIPEVFHTSRKAIRKVSEIIVASENDHGALIDLGSSRGYFVLGLLHACPGLHITGIDNSRLRTWLARLRGHFHRGHATFTTQNIFDTDISQADCVYIYVPQELLPALAQKLEKELKDGAIVMTYRIHFPSWTPREVFLLDARNPVEENVYMYRLVKTAI